MIELREIGLDSGREGLELKEIGLDSSLEGLKLLKDILNDPDTSKESPVPFEINEYLYKGFLLLSEEEVNIKRYWVYLEEQLIGYSDIRIDGEIGEFGIVLKKDFHGKGYGLEISKKLIEIIRNNYNLNQIRVSVDKENYKCKKMCKKLIDSDKSLNIDFSIN